MGPWHWFSRHAWRFQDDQEVTLDTVFTIGAAYRWNERGGYILSYQNGLESLTGEPNVSLDTEQQGSQDIGGVQQASADKEDNKGSVNIEEIAVH